MKTTNRRDSQVARFFYSLSVAALSFSLARAKQGIPDEVIIHFNLKKTE